MKWPFMLVSTHDMDREKSLAIESLQSQLITSLTAQIADKDRQISALTEILTQQKCNDYTSKDPEKSKKGEPFSTGRGGWRTRASLASQATIPVASDSQAQLDQRVKDQGGKA